MPVYGPTKAVASWANRIFYLNFFTTETQRKPKNKLSKVALYPEIEAIKLSQLHSRNSTPVSLKSNITSF